MSCAGVGIGVAPDLHYFMNSSRCAINVPALSRSQSVGSCRSGVASRGTRRTWLPPRQRRRRASDLQCYLCTGEDRFWRGLIPYRFTGRAGLAAWSGLEVVCTEKASSHPVPPVVRATMQVNDTPPLSSHFRSFVLRQSLRAEPINLPFRPTAQAYLDFILLPIRFEPETSGIPSLLVGFFVSL